MIFEDGPLSGALFESDEVSPREVRYCAPGGSLFVYQMRETSATALSDGTIWSEARYRMVRSDIQPRVESPLNCRCEADPEVSRAVDWLIESTKQPPGE